MRAVIANFVVTEDVCVGTNTALRSKISDGGFACVCGQSKLSYWGVTEEVFVRGSKPCEANVRLFADQAESVCARVRFQHGQRTPGLN